MTTEANGNVINVLLVEDNPADARLAEETIKKSEHTVNITVAEDGEQAMAMLQGEGAISPRPDLILLDLRLPNKDGTEVLAEISQDAEISSIPVIILTGTEAEQSLLNSYNIPPSRYWRKPITVDRFNMAVRQLAALSRQPITLGASQSQAVPVGAGVGGDGDRKKKWWWPF